MYQLAVKWFKKRYKRIVTSIAFLPAIIATVFLLLSFVMISFDFSEVGKSFKANLHWLSLKDASTARSICSVIAGGIISLAVFSFSMVMILLNQAASQMSNRILGKLISNRFQQIVLGFYIGTIVYALFLLSTIRDINSGIYVPSISTYFLIALTIADIFLFIYFLHYITQAIKYETIIHKIYDTTKKELTASCVMRVNTASQPEIDGIPVAAHKSGLYQGFDSAILLSLCEKHDLIVSFLLPVGTFLLEGTPLFKVSGKEILPQELEKDLHETINIHRGQDIETSYYFGLSHLMEIAIKALSPGINDPGTALISLNALGDLLSSQLGRSPEIQFRDNQNIVRVHVKEKSFDEIFEEYLLPIWDYGKNDRLIQHGMLNILTQLKMKGQYPAINKLLMEVQIVVKIN